MVGKGGLRLYGRKYAGDYGEFEIDNMYTLS